MQCVLFVCALYAIIAQGVRAAAPHGPTLRCCTRLCDTCLRSRWTVSETQLTRCPSPPLPVFGPYNCQDTAAFLCIVCQRLMVRLNGHFLCGACCGRHAKKCLCNLSLSLHAGASDAHRRGPQRRVPSKAHAALRRAGSCVAERVSS